MSIQRVPVRDIVPNRYRKIDSYRISEEKIAALIQSYDNSGFWDGSLQARPHPTRSGKVEIAFGHHRIEAAKRQKLEEVGLVVANRSDADMLRMMADENREEFKGDHLVAIETVAATVEAFGRGEIDLPPIEAGGRGTSAFTLPGGKEYNLATVARFLNWIKPSDRQATNACRLAFAAYHEKANIVPALQRLPEDDRTRQTTTAVLDAVKSARHSARRAGQSNTQIEAAAKRAATVAVDRIKKGEIATKVKEEAHKIGRKAARVERSAPEIDAFVHHRAEGIRTRVINLTHEVEALLNDLWPYRDQLHPAAARDLARALEFSESRLTGFFANWLKRFTEVPTRNITPTRKLLKGA